MYVSSEQGKVASNDSIALCCGQAPQVLFWRRKGFVALTCQNPACPNAVGVLGYSRADALQEWERYRVVSKEAE
jgi:hypothetical protein